MASPLSPRATPGSAGMPVPTPASALFSAAPSGASAGGPGLLSAPRPASGPSHIPAAAPAIVRGEAPRSMLPMGALSARGPSLAARPIMGGLTGISAASPRVGALAAPATARSSSASDPITAAASLPSGSQPRPTTDTMGAAPPHVQAAPASAGPAGFFGASTPALSSSQQGVTAAPVSVPSPAPVAAPVTSNPSSFFGAASAPTPGPVTTPRAPVLSGPLAAAAAVPAVRPPAATTLMPPASVRPTHAMDAASNGVAAPSAVASTSSMFASIAAAPTAAVPPVTALAPASMPPRGFLAAAAAPPAAITQQPRSGTMPPATSAAIAHTGPRPLAAAAAPTMPSPLLPRGPVTAMPMLARPVTDPSGAPQGAQLPAGIGRPPLAPATTMPPRGAVGAVSISSFNASAGALVSPPIVGRPALSSVTSQQGPPMATPAGGPPMSSYPMNAMHGPPVGGDADLRSPAPFAPGAGGPPTHGQRATGPSMQAPGGGGPPTSSMHASTAMHPPPMQAPPPPLNHAAHNASSMPPLSRGPPIGGGSMSPAPSTPSTSTAQRIDPNAVPRPKYPSAYNPARFPTTGEGFNVPPPSWSEYIAEDAGNASPRFIRATMNHVPITTEIMRQSHMPMAVIVTPLAQLGYGEHPLPLVDFGVDGPVRCTRCRAYINPFARWTDGGASWTCNLCGASNEASLAYQCAVDQYGQRRDRVSRPELCCGSVEFTAPPGYLLRPPTPLCILFVLDTTYQAVASGALTTAIHAIRSSLEQLQHVGEGRVRVGLVSFDSKVYMYDVHPARSAPGVAIMPDVDDAYSALAPDQVCPPVAASHALLQAALELIEGVAQSPSVSREVQSCAGSAIKAAVDALASTGGRVVVFQSLLPQVGEGKLTNREGPGSYGTEAEKKLLLPASGSTFWTDMGSFAASRGVSVDINVLTSQYVDAATMTAVTTATCGTCRVYPAFMPAPSTGAPPDFAAQYSEAAERVVEELRESLLREQGTDAVLKVRTSPGLRVARYVGCFTTRADGEADLAGLDSDKAVEAVLELDGSALKEGEELYAQAALLYTNEAGERRIRVHTLRMMATESIQAVFRHADIDAILTHLARHALALAVKKDASAVLPELTDMCIDMLHGYRKHCAANSSPGQLILPESLKLLPVYLSALTKATALVVNDRVLLAAANKAGTAVRAVHGGLVRADARVASIGFLNSLSPHRLVPFIYPRLFLIHAMRGMHGTALDSDDDVATLTSGQERLVERLPVDPDTLSYSLLRRVVLPPTTFPSAEQLDPQGIYLLEHSQGLFVYVGLEAPSHLVQELYGEDITSSAMVPPLAPLPRCNTETSLRLWTVIACLRVLRQAYVPVVSVAPADMGNRDRFMALLTEDKVGASPSYVDILCDMHTRIQAKLTAGT